MSVSYLFVPMSRDTPESDVMVNCGSFACHIMIRATFYRYPQIFRTMSTSSPQLPSLTSWTQPRLAALMIPSGQESDLHSNFHSTFAPDAEIIINHSPIPYETFKKNTIAKTGAATNAKVEWKHITEVPAEEGDNANLVHSVFVLLL